MSQGATSATPAVVRQAELARYSVHGCERMLYASRLDGVVRIVDRPAAGRGRCYLVECCRERDGYEAIEALVADYLHQARCLGEIPMLAGVRERIDQVVLTRYRLSCGERVLYGQTVNGVVRVTDRPASGPDRCYLVECGLERDGYSALEALVVDYTCQARRLDDVPMAATTLRRTVER